MPGTIPSIRKAEHADRRAIEKIAQGAHAPCVPRMDRKPFPMLDDYGAHIANGAASVFEDGGGIRGDIILLAADDEALLLDNVAIDPSAQKCGYGRKLLAFAEAVARERGLGRSILYTNAAMHENLAWYPGYAVTAHVAEKGYKRIYLEKTIDG